MYKNKHWKLVFKDCQLIGFPNWIDDFEGIHSSMRKAVNPRIISCLVNGKRFLLNINTFSKIELVDFPNWFDDHRENQTLHKLNQLLSIIEDWKQHLVDLKTWKTINMEYFPEGLGEEWLMEFTPFWWYTVGRDKVPFVLCQPNWTHDIYLNLKTWNKFPSDVEEEVSLDHFRINWFKIWWEEFREYAYETETSWWMPGGPWLSSILLGIDSGWLCWKKFLASLETDKTLKMENLEAWVDHIMLNFWVPKFNELGFVLVSNEEKIFMINTKNWKNVIKDYPQGVSEAFMIEVLNKSDKLIKKIDQNDSDKLTSDDLIKMVNDIVTQSPVLKSMETIKNTVGKIKDLWKRKNDL